ncbi:ribonuclease H-like domain-containing protein [Tanacetum coccineum]
MENLRDPIEIKVDVVHLAPVALVAFPAATEELTALRFKVDIAEAENAPLRATIRTMEAIETVTRNHERQARIEIECSSFLLLNILKDQFCQVLKDVVGLLVWAEALLYFSHGIRAKVVALVLLGSIGGGSSYIGAPPPPPLIGGDGGDNPQVVLISNLDAGNPLHVHNSDNSSSVLVLFKLLGTENYRMWNNAMKLALQARNKYGFVDGSCVRDSYADSDVLCAQWDRLLKLDPYAQQLMKLMQFLMGLDDCYQPVRTALLTRDPLPDVKDAYATVSREESHSGIPETPEAIDAKMHANSFATKEVTSSPLLVITRPSFNCPEQMQKLLNLINDSTSGNTQANMAGRVSFFNGLGQRDNTGHCFVIWGLYLFDDSKNISLGNVNTVMAFNVSKDLWHNRLGHPADQVLNVLKNDLNLSKNTCVSACETCHRAKQTRELFPLSDHKSMNPGELVHLDLWGPYKVSSREGFRYFLTIVDDYSRAVWTYLLKTKDEVFDCIVNFIKLIHNH